MDASIEHQQFRSIVEHIQGAFPQLVLHATFDHPHLDADVTIPQQPGLVFPMNINLQGDELHLSAGSLWVEWFPCTNPTIVAEFRDIVHGLLAGTFRIVEHDRAGVSVKADLQRPTAQGWQTIARWSKLHVPIPWRTTTRIVQNVA
jgi:hypothetical protein